MSCPLAPATSRQPDLVIAADGLHSMTPDQEHALYRAIPLDSDASRTEPHE